MFRTLQQVALLPQKLAPTSLHGSVDPVGAGCAFVQTHGTPSSCRPRYGSHVQWRGLSHSLPHIVHGLPMPSSFGAGGHPGGASIPTSTTPASRGAPHAGAPPPDL